MKYKISEKARRILYHLKQAARPLDTSSIAKTLALRDETVRSLLESLRQQKLIEDYEKSYIQYFQLTPEGQQFARKGLPEVRLMKILVEQRGEGSLTVLAEKGHIKPSEQKLALGWARRNGWISVTKRNKHTWLKLRANADTAAAQHPLQMALNVADESGILHEDQINFDTKAWQAVQYNLQKRKLAKLVSKQVTTVIITPTGNRALETAIAQKDMIRDLSPDLLKSGEWKDRDFLPYNLSAPTSPFYPGKKHPYIEFIDRVKRILIGLGFQEAKGPLVELEFWNSDALFMPQDHVAREVHDLYHIKTPKGPGQIIDEGILKRVAKTHENGWNTGSTGWRYAYRFDIARRLVLRSQTTAVSVRFLAEHQTAPLRMFSIDRNFRPEKFDATHSAEFLQCEGIIGGEGLTLRDLMGYLRRIAEEIGIKKIKFKPGFFPFTEPSVEGFIFIPGLGWKEALPGGVFRPEVTLPLGIDFPVLAWGIGIDRLAMAALEINDIRELATRNLGWLRAASMRF